MSAYDFGIYGRQQPAVIIELGSAHIKCGFAGDAAPRHIVGSGTLGALAGRWPPPEPREWRAAADQTLAAVYFDALRCKPKDRACLVITNHFAPTALRRAVAATLFERLGVPRVLFASCARSALRTTGCVSGVIVDCGARETRVTPVYEGRLLARCIRTVPAGRATMVDALRAGRRGASLSDARAAEAVASRCVFAPEPHAAAADADAAVADAAEAAEAFFAPADTDGRTVASAVLEAVGACPVDVRPVVVQNVLIVGGTAALPGLRARFAHEIRAAAEASRPEASRAPGERRAAEPSSGEILPFGDEVVSASACALASLDLAPSAFAPGCAAWTGGSLLAAGLADAEEDGGRFARSFGRAGDEPSDGRAGYMTAEAYAAAGRTLPDDFRVDRDGSRDAPPVEEAESAAEPAESTAEPTDSAAEATDSAVLDLDPLGETY
jgi:actin-related protein 10